MKDEPDIVKELGDAEKFGLFQSKVKNAIEELKTGEESPEKTKETDGFFRNSGKSETVNNGSDQTYGANSLEGAKFDFQDLFENINDLIQAVRPDGTFLYVNSAWKKTLGYTDKEIKKLKVFEIIHPSSKEHCMAKFKRILSGEKADNVEAIFVSKNGKEIVVEGSINCRFDNGKPVFTYGIFRDITQRKNIEEQLKSQQEQWSSLLNNISDIVMLLDTKGTILYINHTLPGFTVEDTIGTSVYDYLPAEQQSKTKHALEQVISKGKPVIFETTVALPHGEIIWYSTRLAPIVEEGTIVRVAQISTDITKKKKAEEALKQSEEKYRRLFNSSPDLIIETDGKGNILAVNPIMAKSMGVPTEKLIGRNIFDTLPREIAKVRAKIARKALEEMKVKESEDERAGRYFHNVYVPIIHPDGKKTIQTIVRDVTLQKKAEEQLNNKIEELELFKKVTVGRELKMMELKNRIKELEGG